MSVRDVLAAAVPAAALDEAEAAVARAIAAGRAAWPDVEVAAERLAARVAAELAVRDAAHDADLYLATALAAGDRAALRVFEARLVPEMRAALARLRLPSGAADEVVQAMRVEMLVGAGDERGPHIAEYAGRGELAAWLRVSATRAALKLLRRTQREETLDDVLLAHWPDATPGSASAAERGFKSAYARELKTALADALGQLEVRQRNLLRQHVLDDLTIDELALLYRVHRATCARWLADARAELARGTRARLLGKLGKRADEVDSVLRWLDSDIELSISRILRAP